MAARTIGSARLALLLVLLGAFALRLWDVGEPSVWHDEGWSIRAIRDPIHTPDDNTPPLYYMVMHLLWRGAGDSALALRYGSVWLDVLTIALAARLVRRWAGEYAALLTAALLALSPLLWAYAREIRAYVAVPLFTVLLLALTERLLGNPARRRWWIALWAVELALLYTHNLSVPVVAWLNLVVGASWLAGRRWRLLACWGAGQAALFLAYLPWLLGQSPSGTPINTPPRFSAGLVWDIWRGYFAPLPAMIGREHAVEIGSAVLGVTMVAAATVTLRWNRRPALLALSQALLLPVLVTFELQAAHIDFHPRYYVAGVPATAMVLALAAHSLPGRDDLARLAAPAVLALATGLGAASLLALFDTPAYQHDDFRAIAHYYATLPEDAVILIPYGWEPALDVYYADKVGIAAHIVGIDLHSRAEEAIQAINEALAVHGAPLHVELLTWFQLPADVRGMYPCLLEAVGQRQGSLTVQGLMTTAYRLERPLAFAPVKDGTAEYGTLTLSEAALAGTHNVCLRTRWTVPGHTGADWRVSARLVTLDPPGWTLARSDSDIRDDEQVPTSGWEAGQSGEAFSLLRFPAGAPPGEYVAQVILFSAEQPDGADRLVNGIPAGRALALATVALRTPAPLAGDPPAPLFSITEGVTLVGHDARGGTLSVGQEVRVTLRWKAASTCCRDDPWSGAMLVLQGEGWRLAQPVRVFAPYSLDWHAFLVPAEAEGAAELVLETPGAEPLTLAQYTVERTERLFAPPPFAVPLRSEFVGVAVLEGFSVAQTRVSPDDTLSLTLVWRATATPAISYRVFTHLLNGAGRVIAQHDDAPLGGMRPTTSWVPGEYLSDAYRLVFNDEGRQYRGPARLEVGFYDPQTGARVPLTGGADHVVLPVEITVE